MATEVLGSDGRIKDRQGVPPQGVSMGVYHNGSGTTSFATGSTCIFNTKLWDPYNWYDLTTGLFSPKIPGYYRFSFRVRDSTPPAGGWSRAQAYKAASFCDGDFQTANPGASQGDGIVYLNGTTDSMKVIMTRSDGGNFVVVGGAGAPDHSYLYVNLVGASVGVIPDPTVGAFSQPARSFSTNYQPNLSHPTMVMARFNVTSAVVTGIEMLIGPTNPASTHLGFEQASSSNSNEWRTGTFIVPAGWWYRIGIANGSPGSLLISEWTLP